MPISKAKAPRSGRIPRRHRLFPFFFFFFSPSQCFRRRCRCRAAPPKKKDPGYVIARLEKGIFFFFFPPFLPPLWEDVIRSMIALPKGDIPGLQKPGGGGFFFFFSPLPPLSFPWPRGTRYPLASAVDKQKKGFIFFFPPLFFPLHPLFPPFVPKGKRTTDCSENSLKWKKLGAANEQ